jgi:hypothetical protein
MRWASSRSRSGWAAASSASSPSTPWCPPSRSRASSRSSSAVNRVSVSPTHSSCRDRSGPAAASGGPAHRSSAAVSAATRAASSASVAAAVTPAWNRCASIASGAASSVYVPPPERISATSAGTPARASAERRADTYTCSA